MQDFLNETPGQVFGYRSRYSKIDNLSVFFTLVYTGLLKFEVVEKQIYYYFDIPGYIFTIEEFSRTGENSGWLISSIMKADDTEKIFELNKLLGYE